MVGRPGRYERHAELFEMVVASKLHGQIAGEPVRALNQDHAHTVAGDPRSPEGLSRKAGLQGPPVNYSSILVR